MKPNTNFRRSRTTAFPLRWFPYASIAIGLLLTSGCKSTTNKSASVSSVASQRQEIAVLQIEIKLLMDNLSALDEGLASGEKSSEKMYTPELRSQELDRYIALLRDLRERLARRTKQMTRDYGIDEGPY